MSQLTLALHRVQTQLAEAAHAAGRDAATVQLLAVSKTFPAEAVRAAIATGSGLLLLIGMAVIRP